MERYRNNSPPHLGLQKLQEACFDVCIQSCAVTAKQSSVGPEVSLFHHQPGNVSHISLLQHLSALCHCQHP